MGPKVEGRCRAIELSLEGNALRARPWDLPPGSFPFAFPPGGVAAGTIWLSRRLAARPGAPAFALAVASGVSRGLPTAARASCLGRAPLSGLLASGQIGGDLGPALASHADLLAIDGRTELPGALLRLDRTGSFALVSRPELVGLPPAEVGALLRAELGTEAVLCVGPAGEALLPFASLASGADPPSFVGRGGLGATFAALGLKALCIEPRASDPGPAEEPLPDRELVEALKRSPRLVARAAGGTFELYGALSARGDLPGPDARTRLSGDEAHGLFREAEEARVDRKGCRGCPTPCGWVFAPQGEGAVRQGARFSASQALGSALGLASFDDALRLLARCDELGLDAREAGAVLAARIALREAGETSRGPSRGHLGELDEALVQLVREPEAPGRRGALALLEESRVRIELPSHAGQALGPDSNLAVLLGQHVSGGGVDPMRSLPFLTELGSRERIEERIGLPVPEGAADPRDPRGKGRLVAWSENLVQALDATGFCAFSAVGCLADGVLGVDELARWLLPDAVGSSSGDELLELGAWLVGLRRRIDAALGGRPAQDPEVPLPGVLGAPGMLPEYAAVRGPVPDEAELATGGLWARERARWRALPTTGALSLEPAESESPDRCRGRVSVGSGGALAGILGRRYAYEDLLPMRLDELARGLGEREPRARRWLFADGRLLAGFFRGGERLREDSLVHAGDELEVVLAISGG